MTQTKARRPKVCRPIDLWTGVHALRFASDSLVFLVLHPVDHPTRQNELLGFREGFAPFRRNLAFKGHAQSGVDVIASRLSVAEADAALVVAREVALRAGLLEN